MTESSSSAEGTEALFHIPITGELDLHTFDPRDVRDLLPEYLQECRRLGILRVRVIHGKGSGALLKTVRALLGRSPYVKSYALAPPVFGGWGATWVDLKEAEESPNRDPP